MNQNIGGSAPRSGTASWTWRQVHLRRLGMYGQAYLGRWTDFAERRWVVLVSTLLTVVAFLADRPVIAALILTAGVAGAAVGRTRSVSSPLPLVGGVLHLAATVGVIGWYLSVQQVERASVTIWQFAVVVAAATLVAVGLIIQEFAGSRVWYGLLVLGIGTSAAAMVGALTLVAAEDVNNEWFLAACVYAVGIAAGLLAWRSLTWGWFGFVTVVGASAVLLLTAQGDENRVRLGVLALAMAIVAAAASSLAKPTFRFVTSVVVGLLLVLAVVEGINVRRQGEDAAAAAARQRLETVQLEVIGLHNCVLSLPDVETIGEAAAATTTTTTTTTSTTTSTEVDDSTAEAAEGEDGTGDADGTEEASASAGCSDEAAAGRQPLVIAPPGSPDQVAEANARLLRLVCTETTIGIGPEELRDEGPVLTLVEQAAARQCHPLPTIGSLGIDVARLGGQRPVALQIRPTLDVDRSLAFTADLQRIRQALLAIELEVRGGPSMAPLVAEAADEAGVALQAVEDERQAQQAAQSSLRELFIVGADNAAGELLPGESDDIRLGPYGWLVLGLLALYGYRRAEITNNRRTSSPIVIDEPVRSARVDETDAKHLRAVIEAQLSRAGIEEPASLPASELVDDLVDLVQNDSLQGSGWLAAGLRALKNLGFPTGGITVRPLLDIDGGLTTVTVSVFTSRSRTPLYTQTVTHTDPEVAATHAAYYVARAALNYGKDVPRWARWSGDGGIGFRLFSEATVPAAAGADLDIDTRRSKLLEAIRHSPATTQVRVELGHLEDLRQRPLSSLRFHLEARAESRRLLAAGYRVATSLSMLSAQLDRHWYGPDNQRYRLAVVDLLEENDLLRRAARTPVWYDAGLSRHDLAHVADRLRHDGAVAGDRFTRQVLLSVAWSELRRIQYMVWVPTIIAMAAYQSERRYWLRFLRQPDHRRQTSEQFETAKLIVELRLAMVGLDRSAVGGTPAGDPGPGQHPVEDSEIVQRLATLGRRVEAIVDNSKVGSNAVYNAACFWSLCSRVATSQADRVRMQSRAAELLHRSRRSGRGSHPSAAWIRVDPDLKHLNGNADYNEFLQWLRTDGAVTSLERHSPGFDRMEIGVSR